MKRCEYEYLCDKFQFFVKGKTKAGCIQGHITIYYVKKHK